MLPPELEYSRILHWGFPPPLRLPTISAEEPPGCQHTARRSWLTPLGTAVNELPSYRSTVPNVPTRSASVPLGFQATSWRSWAVALWEGRETAPAEYFRTVPPAPTTRASSPDVSHATEYRLLPV